MLFCPAVIWSVLMRRVLMYSSCSYEILMLFFSQTMEDLRAVESESHSPGLRRCEGPSCFKRYYYFVYTMLA
jgi:hypothetical protein